MGAYMIQQATKRQAHPIQTKKKKNGAPSTTEDAIFHIYIGAFACFLYKTQITLYTCNDSRLFSRSYESSLTVQKNEIIIFHFPQRLPMSPATFWATTFLASSEIGESPIYMSKKASVHQTRNSYKGTVLYCKAAPGQLHDVLHFLSNVKEAQVNIIQIKLIWDFIVFQRCHMFREWEYKESKDTYYAK